VASRTAVDPLEPKARCVSVPDQTFATRRDHRDRAYREAVYQVVGRWLKGVYPVSTGLIVQGLARPEYLMEIDIIAEIPAGQA
jgi:enamine deaminase RidA (YjgF/YER057c/UK114 family)